MLGAARGLGGCPRVRTGLELESVLGTLDIACVLIGH